jgi:hypothetical protein
MNKKQQKFEGITFNTDYYILNIYNSYALVSKLDPSVFNSIRTGHAVIIKKIK